MQLTQNKKVKKIKFFLKNRDRQREREIERKREGRREREKEKERIITYIRTENIPLTFSSNNIILNLSL